MFKQSIAYVDFNGNQRTEDFYFHLSLPEATRLEAEFGMTINEYAQQLAADRDLKKMIDFLETIILNSYGKKTSDGKSFYKSKDLRAEFEYSQAYAELFEKLLTDHELARKFGEGVPEKAKVQGQKNQVTPQVVPAPTVQP